MRGRRTPGEPKIGLEATYCGMVVSSCGALQHGLCVSARCVSLSVRREGGKECKWKAICCHAVAGLGHGIHR